MSETHRITVDPEQCGGRPCLRHLRIRVKDVLDLLAAGATREEVLEDYPMLEAGDITAALEYARLSSNDRVVADDHQIRYAFCMNTIDLTSGTTISRETETDERRLSREAALIAEADADIEAGRVVDSAVVKAWIDSIGTERELPVPYSGR
jgi:uncharacterized protein (DUF433 family)